MIEDPDNPEWTEADFARAKTDKVVRFPVIEGGKPVPPPMRVEVRGVKFPFVPVAR